MTNEEYNQIMTQLRALSNTPEMAQIVQELQTDYTQLNSDLASAKDEQQKAEEKADKYAKLNNELFLQNSAQKMIMTDNINNSGQGSQTENQEQPQKKTYADLETQFFEEERKKRGL